MDLSQSNNSLQFAQNDSLVAMKVWPAQNSSKMVVGYESLYEGDGHAEFSEHSLKTLYNETQHRPNETDVGILLPPCAVTNVLHIQGK